MCKVSTLLIGPSAAAAVAAAAAAVSAELVAAPPADVDSISSSSSLPSGTLTNQIADKRFKPSAEIATKITDGIWHFLYDVVRATKNLCSLPLGRTAP